MDSTNDEAKRLIWQGSGLGEGTVLVADSQTKGRGKPGTGWFSPANVGLYLSIIVRSEKLPQELVSLTKEIAEAIVKTIGCEAAIKLPNDVLIKGKKVCGILSERTAAGYLIIGIGLNINNPPGSFPDDLKKRATSLLIETGRAYDREVLLRELLEQVKILL